MQQLRYCINNAIDLGESRHAQKVMQELGFELIHSLPQSLYDEWWFTVEDNEIELPDFIEPMEYDLEKWGYYEDLKRDEEERLKELEYEKQAKYNIPEGWERTVYRSKKGMTLSEAKLIDKDNKITSWIVIVKKDNEIKAFDRITGEFKDIQGAEE